MITREQFEKARNFIYRHGDLLARRRFAYHFEHGDKQAILDALVCYQNDDSGFGNGLEPDVMCPASSGICTEMAFGYLLELGINDGPVLEHAIEWVLSNRTENGDLPHPVEAVTAYPHGKWWKNDSGRIMSIAGLLGKMGRSCPDISARAAAIFEKTHVPFPENIGVYSYPVALYLRYGNGVGKYARHLEQLEAAFPKMLKKEAWHHPLFFCHDRWDSKDIPSSLWQSEAERAIATLQNDGGVFIEQYSQLPWWRPNMDTGHVGDNEEQRPARGYGLTRTEDVAMDRASEFRCDLGAMDRYDYAHASRFAHVVMLLWYLDIQKY